MGVVLEELLVGGLESGGSLNIYSDGSVTFCLGGGVGLRQAAVPLQTRSMVLTCVPSSMVWMLKSISGRGFFSFIARMALSTCKMRWWSAVVGEKGAWPSPVSMANSGMLRLGRRRVSVR